MMGDVWEEMMMGDVRYSPTYEPSGAADEALRSIVMKHGKEILGLRNEQLERLLVLRLAGLKVRLVEECVSPTKTVWSFEMEGDNGQA